MSVPDVKRSYAAGALIVYGRTGVCRVEGVTERTPPGEKKPVSYYLLNPLYQNGTILAPVEKMEDGSILSRAVMSRDQARKWIEMLPDLPAAPYHNQNVTQLRDYYRRQMENAAAQDLARMIRSIYKKRREAENNKRKLSAVDQRFMDEAEDLLFGELAVALDISREEVGGYIAKTLGKA